MSALAQVGWQVLTTLTTLTTPAPEPRVRVSGTCPSQGEDQMVEQRRERLGQLNLLPGVEGV